MLLDQRAPEKKKGWCLVGSGLSAASIQLGAQFHTSESVGSDMDGHLQGWIGEEGVYDGLYLVSVVKCQAG